MVDTILSWGDFIVVVILIIILLIILYYVAFCSLTKAKIKKTTNEINHYAILIPARDESNVIENILISIEKQTYKISMKDVYVIVEREDDPTVDIVKRHKASYFVRTNLENRHRKGYALDECIKEIKNEGYLIKSLDEFE